LRLTAGCSAIELLRNTRKAATARSPRRAARRTLRQVLPEAPILANPGRPAQGRGWLPLVVRPPWRSRTIPTDPPPRATRRVARGTNGRPRRPVVLHWRRLRRSAPGAGIGRGPPHATWPSPNAAP